MTDMRSEAETLNSPDASERRRRGWYAAGGVLGAILASSCCIVPLLLVTLGVSGAWIGTLTILEPYKPWFAAVTLVFIGLGFRHVYFKARSDCAAGSYCAQSATVAKSALWGATVLVAMALTINWWAPYLY